MNGAQQLLAIAAIFLLTTLILNVNRSTTDKIITTYSNESFITGTGIAQSMIDEIIVKSFDENTVDKPVFETSSLTPSSSFGPDGSETDYRDFDDIDDYDGYTKTESTDRMGDFNIQVHVGYVLPDNLEQETSQRTFTKRIKVMVTNFSLPDTIKLYQIVGY